MHSLPLHLHDAAILAERRSELELQATAAILTGRILAQPTMAGASGPRSQPRDGRGRFLPGSWLRAAESYSAADLAWFRGPVGA